MTSFAWVADMSDYNSERNGKGDLERVRDRDRFNKNWDNIFGPRKEAEVDSEEKEENDE